MKKSILIAAAVMLAGISHGQMFAQMFGQNDVTSGLVNRWTFNSISDNVSLDSVGGSSFFGVGSPTSISGIVGDALQFNIAASNQSMTNSTFSLTGQKASICFWWWAATNTTAVGIEYSKNFNLINGFMFQADTRSVFLSSSSSAYSGGVFGDVPKIAWYHMVFLLDYSKTAGQVGVDVYINSSKVPLTGLLTNNLSSVSFTSGRGLYIAARNGSEFFAKCAIDDLRYYNRILTEPEIKTIYAARQ